LSISDGRAEYYGWRATERLQALAVDEKAREAIRQQIETLRSTANSTDQEIARKSLQGLLRLTRSEDDRNKYLAQLGVVYKNHPAYRKISTFSSAPLGRTKLVRETAPNSTIADELLFLGLCDEGAFEYEASARSKSPDLAYALAQCFEDGNFADRSVAFIEPLWRNVPADYQIELIPRNQLQMLFPTPFVVSLLKHSAPRSVDPRFVLSIMRQESRYRADVKSNAAARGLMQFISSTANTTAAKAGLSSFSQDDLYNPDISILLGSQYIADLFKTFPEQPHAVAASYNGGDDNVRRWMQRSRSNSPDQYVPEIVFTQTKDYVYKVMANYRIYQFLYEKDLRSKN
jgi:soluble lytic murein transglycosylase